MLGHHPNVVRERLRIHTRSSLNVVFCEVVSAPNPRPRHSLIKWALTFLCRTTGDDVRDIDIKRFLKSYGWKSSMKSRLNSAQSALSCLALFNRRRAASTVVAVTLGQMLLSNGRFPLIVDAVWIFVFSDVLFERTHIHRFADTDDRFQNASTRLAQRRPSSPSPHRSSLLP